MNVVPCYASRHHPTRPNMNPIRSFAAVKDETSSRYRLPVLLLLLVTAWPASSGFAETLRHPEPMETLLRETDLGELARQVELRGDPRRGAIVFYTSGAGCVKCHTSGAPASPLGPDLASLSAPPSRPSDTVADRVENDRDEREHNKPYRDRDAAMRHVIESLLFPSRVIRPGYETVSVLTDDGQVIRGMVAREDDSQLVLRDASDLEQEVTVSRDAIEVISIDDNSMMPDGLVGVFPEPREFYDLASYVTEVALGGPEKAAELKPSEDQLRVTDDTQNLDHAGILRRLRARDFETGEKIYHGYCFNCHGVDGNTPSLPTARAFGTEKLKFGADPYRMFLTLSRGNGLMAPMSHLTPKERYQVVHYIREAFMKGNNPDFVAVDDEYLAGLPEGSDLGESVPTVERDFGPALGSQLRREVNSALTLPLGDVSISYDLHSMDVAGLWYGGFLDLDQTQHVRGRGEGTAEPAGSPVTGLDAWQWGHEGNLDYPTDDLPPRGPMPKRWMEYRGHYRHGDNVVLRYTIDGRPVLEWPRQIERPTTGRGNHAVSHTLRIGGGDPLVLAVARGGEGWERLGGSENSNGSIGPGGQPASAPIVLAPGDDDGAVERFLAVAAVGETDGLRWTVDDERRVVLNIPAGNESRVVEIVRQVGTDAEAMRDFASDYASNRSAATDSAATDSAAADHRTPTAGTPVDPESMTRGGPPLWTEVMETVGYTGLEPGGYRLDTITIPEQTPWNTWFRTSALDFFPDGRMVVTTYGGDVWIVSGIDRDLLSLRWKRFASGLYEPFGVKVVDGKIYVTCKDRLTRLHDLNDDGEADYYESFHADPDVSVNFHAFNFDLQVDSEGNFYYAKSGHGADFDLPGAVFKVAPDGKSHEIYSTGFRTPNGMGIMPGDRLLASDNQGQWTPASKINLLKPGGFYGWVQTYSKPGMWAPGGGEIDLDEVTPPETFDPPLVWMPQDLDNSSGGQVFADDPRWGPLAGHLLHTSFGKGWMFYLMTQEVGETTQAAIIKLPFDFRTGIMRARVNPADGQVYATGLDGWNGGGRAGMLDQGIQRLQYTGKPYKIVSDCQAETDGLRVEFNFPLDPDSARDPESYVAEQWDYKWQASYGSDFYSPKTGERGKEPLGVTEIEVSDDGHTVTLRVPDLQPADQVHLQLDLKAADGERFREEIYWTLNAVPGKTPSNASRTQ